MDVENKCKHVQSFALKQVKKRDCWNKVNTMMETLECGYVYDAAVVSAPDNHPIFYQFFTSRLTNVWAPATKMAKQNGNVKARRLQPGPRWPAQ